jgi:hypothetical protein
MNSSPASLLNQLQTCQVRSQKDFHCRRRLSEEEWSGSVFALDVLYFNPQPLPLIQEGLDHLEVVALARRVEGSPLVAVLVPLVLTSLYRVSKKSKITF